MYHIIIFIKIYSKIKAAGYALFDENGNILFTSNAGPYSFYWCFLKIDEL